MIRMMKILITGATGRLGRVLQRCYSSEHEVLSPQRHELDLSQPQCLQGLLGKFDFDLLINCAAMTSPDVCEHDLSAAMRVNAESPGLMSAECQRRGARMIQISTDYVFGGHGTERLSELSETMPVNTYGRSKLAGEQAVLAANDQALVARVSWLFGGELPSFPEQILKRVWEHHFAEAIEDKWSTPTSTVDVARWLQELFKNRPEVKGTLHLCNTGSATWQTYAQQTVDLALQFGMISEPIVVQGRRLDTFEAFNAKRPKFSVMSNELLAQHLGYAPRSWQAALSEHLQATVSKGSV